MIHPKSIILGVFILLASSIQAWGNEKITLKNGKVITVETAPNGMPYAAKSDKASGVAIAPIVAPAKELKLSKPIQGKVALLWMFSGNLTVAGNFKVSVSSPIDESITGTFEAKGPGKFYFQGAEKTEAPAAWAWIDESGDSWIGLTLTFTDVASNQSFQITQWHRFGSNQKSAVKAMIKKLESE